MKRSQRGRLAPLVLFFVFAALLVVGALPRLAQSRARDTERTEANAAPSVFTETVTSDTAGTPLEMPGTVTGLH
jgi:hypothetical protein